MQTEEIDPMKLQKKLNDLYRERKKLVSDIKVALSRKRWVSETIKENANQDGKVQLKQSSSMAIKSQESISQPHKHLKTQEEEIKKVVDAQNGIKERNKRMFGGLTGHLKKAEKSLQKEESKTKEKLNVEQRVVRREREEGVQLHCKKLGQMELQLQGMTLRKERNREELLRVQNQLLKQKFIAYVSDLSSCLLTQKSPVIAWRPANFSEQLSKLKDQQLEGRNKSEVVVTEGISSYSEKFDFTIYTRQNQKQYYNYILENYFKSKINFITTKTTPKICWRPCEQGVSRCSSLLLKSKALLDQECSKMMAQNDQHYSRAVPKEQQHQLEQHFEQDLFDSAH